MTKSNYEIWNARYTEEIGIARWPFDIMISMVMQRFGSVRNKSSIKILDYGSGGGNNFWFLIKEGFNAYGCDISPASLRFVKDRMSKENIMLHDEQLTLLEGGKMPYQSDTFDAIIDRESLCQSNWEEIQARVEEFSRILKPGGWYLGMNFTSHHPDVKLGKYISNGDYKDFSAGLFLNGGSRHLFSVNEINKLFATWEIDNLSEYKIQTLVGDNSKMDTSEYIIAAKNINK